MQRFQGVEFDSALAVDGLEVATAKFGFLDGRARQTVLLHLVLGQGDGLQVDVHVKLKLVHQKLDLPGHRNRHAIAGRVKVGDVENAGGSLGFFDAADQIEHGGDGHFASASDQIGLVLIAEGAKDIIHGGLFNPDLQMVRLEIDVKAGNAETGQAGVGGKVDFHALPGIQFVARRIVVQ